MLRTIAISLILLLSVGIMLPFANSAHGIRQSTQIAQKKKSKRYRSKAWWRRYRARMRAKRAAAELARRNAMMALPQNIRVGDLSAAAGPALPTLPANASTSFQELPPSAMQPAMQSGMQPMEPTPVTNAVLPAAETTNTVAATAAPVQSSPVAASPASAPLAAHAAASATRPRVVNAVRPVLAPGSNKQLPGQMNLSVVALSRPNPLFLTSREQKKMLAGVPVSDLRRIVIDKMVASGGWVVNDFVRDVNGNRVFVVTARTPKDALTPEKAWTFYFTEAGGRVYGLTTEAPVQYADRMTTEAERFIESLRTKSKGAEE